MLSASERSPVLPLDYLETNLLDLRACHFAPPTADPVSRESVAPPFLLPGNARADPILDRDENRNPGAAAEGENVTDDTENRDFELSTQEESSTANEIGFRSQGEYTLEARSVAGQGKNHHNSFSTTLTHPLCYSTVHKYRNRGGAAAAGEPQGYWALSVPRGSSTRSRSPGSPPEAGLGRPVTTWGGTPITPMTGAWDCESLEGELLLFSVGAGGGGRPGGEIGRARSRWKGIFQVVEVEVSLERKPTHEVPSMQGIQLTLTFVASSRPTVAVQVNSARARLNHDVHGSLRLLSSAKLSQASRLQPRQQQQEQMEFLVACTLELLTGDLFSRNRSRQPQRKLTVALTGVMKCAHLRGRRACWVQQAPLVGRGQA